MGSLWHIPGFNNFKIKFAERSHLERFMIFPCCRERKWNYLSTHLGWFLVETSKKIGRKDWYLEAKETWKSQGWTESFYLLYGPPLRRRRKYLPRYLLCGAEDKCTRFLGKIDEHCKEEKNETVGRYKCRCRFRHESASFDQFESWFEKKSQDEWIRGIRRFHNKR